MLLNEFLKEHKKVQEQARQIEEQAAVIAELQSSLALHGKRFEQQQACIEKLTSGLQQVGAHLEGWKARSQVVLTIRGTAGQATCAGQPSAAV
jgi:uncharacterized coiled-coil protein SlyX